MRFVQLGRRSVSVFICIGLGIILSLWLAPPYAAQPLQAVADPGTASVVAPSAVELVDVRAAILVENEPISPIPLQLDLNEGIVKLGEKLFFDKRLSGNNQISCASCHGLNTGGTDRLPRSIGVTGEQVATNSPTVFNTGFHFRQSWDGRVETLAQQAQGPIFNEKVMGSRDWPEVIGKLKQDTQYVSEFRRLYPEGISPESIKHAIATYEQSLYTPNAPFDKYLRGDENAITPIAKEGYGLFKDYGCVSCHQGTLVGGNMYQTFGLLGDYFSDRSNITKADMGRFNVTQDERDRYVFKVPSLRNVALTRPYFHDGSAETLDEAIKVMARYQLGRQIPQSDIDAIIQFLRSLTGEYQGEAL